MNYPNAHVLRLVVLHESSVTLLMATTPYGCAFFSTIDLDNMGGVSSSVYNNTSIQFGLEQDFDYHVLMVLTKTINARKRGNNGDNRITYCRVFL